MALPVPHRAVGALMGPGGRMLAAMKEVTGALITVSSYSDFVPNTKDRLVAICGGVLPHPPPPSPCCSCGLLQPPVRSSRAAGVHAWRRQHGFRHVTGQQHDTCYLHAVRAAAALTRASLLIS